MLLAHKRKIAFCLKVFSLKLLVGLFATSAHAATAADELENFFRNLKTFTANFEQTVVNAKLGGADNAKGVLYIKRPGRFRWDYETPYKQEIVSDGKLLWIYDVDLEQVTTKKFDQAVGSTPAVLLSSDQPLNKTFSLKELGEHEGLKWLQLIPKEKNASFKSMELGLANGVLVQMLLDDNLDQTTQLIFSKQKRNVKIDSALFVFKVPEGVDVFESSGE